MIKNKKSFGSKSNSSQSHHDQSLKNHHFVNLHAQNLDYKSKKAAHKRSGSANSPYFSDQNDDAKFEQINKKLKGNDHKEHKIPQKGKENQFNSKRNSKFNSKFNKNKGDSHKKIYKGNDGGENKDKFDKKKDGNQKSHDQSSGKVVELKKVNFLYNDLMAKKKGENSKDGKTKFDIITQILKIISGILTKIVHKHDGCRIIQGCLKYGNKEQKKVIVDAFANDKFLEITKSKYGHFLALKLIKYLHKDHKQLIMNLIFKNLDIFLTQFEGAKVLDKYVSEIPCKKQMKEYYDPLVNIDENDPATHEKAENLAVKILEKKTYYYPLQQKIIHKCLKILIPNEREKFLNQLQEEFTSLLGSKEGSALACTLIDYYGTKQRKNILKQFKGKVMELLNAEHSYAYIVIMKIFVTLDDTVQIHKNILNELNKNLETLVSNPHFSEMYLSIFDPKQNYLEKNEIISNDFSQSKKDPEIRRKELVEYCLHPLVNAFSFDLTKHLTDSNNSKLIGCLVKEILISDSDDITELLAFITSVITKIISDYRDHSKKGKTQEESLLCHAITHRLVKSFVVEFANYTGGRRDYYQEKIDQLFELVFKELAVLVNTKAIFIIIAMIEFTDYKDQIVNELRKMKHLLKKAGSGNSTGINILLKHIEA